VKEQKILSGLYFFFGALPLDIKSMKIVDYTRYNGVKVEDDHSEVHFYIDSR
jgi:hypothetical protein